MAGTATTPPAVVVMGVSGSGKTTVAEALAERLGVEAAEADEFHPQSNIDKMTEGHPLDDADRAPWLAAIADWLADRAADGRVVVITCSALKRAYRDTLRGAGEQVVFLHLDGSKDVIAERMTSRHGHFMPPALLDSQLADLEPLADDERGVRVDLRRAVPDIVEQAVTALDLEPARDQSGAAER